MSKLYVFGIGGTGARVLKSLCFLLATGVKCKSTTVVPILIDPDAANSDVNHTVEILRLYKNIRSMLTFDDETSNQFYKTNISPINPNFRINIQDSKKKFKEFIDYQSLDERNKALISLLFSEKNLNADLEVGFKGNPNMGSVVLNQFNTSKDFEDFASSFAQGDKIFIISSIFGGTGAAGFPLLLKNIRSASPNLNNHSLLKNASIGAVSVLPYFGVKKNEESDIEKSTFISKTKAALRYYEHGVNDSVNSMYYLGDKLVKDYDNNEGGVEQKNDAHFVELASALAILDFANDSDLSINKVKEFGIENESQNIVFNDLGDKTKSDLLKPLSKYYFFRNYLENALQENLNSDFAKRLNIKGQFLNEDFYLKLKKFNEYLWDWLIQMSGNQRGFSPFTLNPKNDIFSNVKGLKPHKSIIGINSLKGYERITAGLNKTAKKMNTSESTEDRFMELFFDTTEKLMTDKYKL
ncbi:MAG: hypothetical protein LAT51_09065 [Flavobacteriaceae bacterium]|nr:hypothetical protein [Flavobacteriaceae bacterium]